jgi:hypothetical protein
MSDLWPYTDPDFECRLELPKSRWHPSEAKTVTLKVWINGTDENGCKLFKYLCENRRDSAGGSLPDHMPSELRYCKESNTLDAKHPGSSFFTLPISRRDAFVRAYEEHYIVNNILLGIEGEHE